MTIINGEIINFTVYRKKFQDDLAIAGWSVVLASMSPLYRLKLCHAEKLFHWTKMKESMFGTSRQGECEQYVDRHTCWHKMKNFGRKNCHRQWNSFWSEEKIPWQTEAQEMLLYHKWQVWILAVNLMFIIWEVWKSPVGFNPWTSGLVWVDGALTTELNWETNTDLGHSLIF